MAPVGHFRGSATIHTYTTVKLVSYLLFSHIPAEPEAPGTSPQGKISSTNKTFYMIKIKCNWYETYSDTICDHEFLASSIN